MPVAARTATFATASTEKYTIDNVTFAKNTSGAVSITINNTPSCDITTSGSSIILNYDNVTVSCRQTSNPNSLTDNATNAGTGNTLSGSFTVALIDATSDGIN